MIGILRQGLHGDARNPNSPTNMTDDDDDAVAAIASAASLASSSESYNAVLGLHTPVTNHVLSVSDADHLVGNTDPDLDCKGDQGADTDSQNYCVDVDGVDGTPSASGATRERHSLSLDQRRALRLWANSQTSRPSHRSCIEWFYAEYGQLISQSTVSHSLSPKYSRLDGDVPQLSGSRLRFGNWPDVEKVVLLWYQQVQSSGRNPSNEELGEKAKLIFSQLPRYRDEAPPEFSPGWIHRFKKRYGLLIRRQRRHADRHFNPAEDIGYLTDCVPRFMTITPETSPAAIKESILRVVGVESSVHICALVRDEILRRNTTPSAAMSVAALLSGDDSPVSSALGVHPSIHHQQQHPASSHLHTGNGDQVIYHDEDAEVVLQTALRQLQQEEQDAEDNAAAVREERNRAERLTTLPSLLSTPSGPRGGAGGAGILHGSGVGSAASAHFIAGQDTHVSDFSLAALPSNHERPQRCPFCINHRSLRTIRDAIDHISTHVVV